MSVADAYQLPPDIRAALLWDVPALREAGPAADSLIKAFGPMPWDLNESGSGPLQVAAEGVAAAGLNRVGDALATTEQLIGAAEPAVQLLGRTLRAWFWDSYEERRLQLEQTIGLAHNIADSDDRARVLRKLAMWAFEIGESAVAADATNAALQAAAPDSRLAWTLRGLAHNLSGDLGPWPTGALPDDALITQPWVSDLAFDGLVTADLERFRDGLAGAWSGTMRMGQTPQDVLNAAQRQADWAAATWMRDTFLQLLCSQLLDRAAGTDELIQWAAASWVLAGGDKVSAVLQRAEPAFTAATARDLLDAVERHPLRRERFPQVAQGVWRIVDDDQVARLLDALDPGEPGQVVNPESRQIWASLLWRDPELWYQKWQGLDAMHRLGAMAQLDPPSIDRLSAEARTELLATVEKVNDLRAYAVIGAALAIAVDVDPRRWFDETRPDGVLALSDWRRDAIPDDVISRSIDTARAAVVADREQAISGSFGLGGSSRSVLGGLVARLGEPNPSAEQLLIDVAADSRMSSDHQVEALQGLVYLRHAGLLSDDARGQLRELPR